jgi:hypothetical protein
MHLSGFFLKKKPPSMTVETPRELENRSKANSFAQCAHSSKELLLRCRFPPHKCVPA